MNDHLCKKCGQAMQWVGSIANGALECTECKEAETLGESVEMARLKAEEIDFMDLLAVPSTTKLELFDADDNLLVTVELNVGKPARNSAITLGGGTGKAICSGYATKCVITGPFGSVTTDVCTPDCYAPGAFVMTIRSLCAGDMLALRDVTLGFAP